MKKMFTLFLGLVMVSVLFAQYDGSYGNRSNQDRHVVYGNGNYGNNNPNYRPDQAVTMHTNDNRWQPQGRMSDNERRGEIDRVNRDYDRQIDIYRNNRYLNGYERDRRIDRLRRERADRLNKLGAGVLIGGVLGVIIGSHL